MNPDRVGTRYPTVSFTVSSDRVARFASAVDDEGTSVPPTFLTVPEIVAGLSRAIADEKLGLDLSRVVHGEQSYEWRRPLRVEETVEVTSEIESIRSKGGLEFLVLRTEFRGREGDLVAIGESTLIVRSDQV